MSVAIIDYGSGNLHSAHKAFERAAREAGTDPRVLVTSSPAEVAAAPSGLARTDRGDVIGLFPEAGR